MRKKQEANSQSPKSHCSGVAQPSVSVKDANAVIDLLERTESHHENVKALCDSWVSRSSSQMHPAAVDQLAECETDLRELVDGFESGLKNWVNEDSESIEPDWLESLGFESLDGVKFRSKFHSNSRKWCIVKADGDVYAFLVMGTCLSVHTSKSDIRNLCNSLGICR